MGIYSPYAVAESEQPQWKPGENLAAAAFVGMALFIVLDVNVGIWRVFRKRTGYYYWSMKLGTLACAVDALESYSSTWYQIRLISGDCTLFFSLLDGPSTLLHSCWFFTPASTWSTKATGYNVGF